MTFILTCIGIAIWFLCAGLTIGIGFSKDWLIARTRLKVALLCLVLLALWWAIPIGALIEWLGKEIE